MFDQFDVYQAAIRCLTSLFWCSVPIFLAVQGLLHAYQMDKLIPALAIHRQQSTQMVITLLASSNAQLHPQFLDG